MFSYALKAVEIPGKGNNVTWTCTTTDGSIYGIPKRNPLDTINDSFGVRADVLKELNVNVPGTVDEFYQMLKTVSVL